jgi:hypothetical protein
MLILESSLKRIKWVCFIDEVCPGSELCAGSTGVALGAIEISKPELDRRAEDVLLGVTVSIGNSDRRRPRRSGISTP